MFLPFTLTHLANPPNPTYRSTRSSESTLIHQVIDSRVFERIAREECPTFSLLTFTVILYMFHMFHVAPGRVLITIVIPLPYVTISPALKSFSITVTFKRRYDMSTYRFVSACAFKLLGSAKQSQPGKLTSCALGCAHSLYQPILLPCNLAS